MDFDKLFEIYGDELPDMLTFLYDGKHAVTLRMIARFYGARRGYLVWDKFVKDYAMHVMKKKAEQVAGKAASKTEDILDKVEKAVDVAEDIVDVVDGVLDLFGKGDDDEDKA